MSTPEISASLAEICESLREIAESLDYMAARPESGQSMETVLRNQANLDYDWLKSLVHKAMPDLTDGEYQAIYYRIARLAGL